MFILLNEYYAATVCAKAELQFNHSTVVVCNLPTASFVVRIVVQRAETHRGFRAAAPSPSTHIIYGISERDRHRSWYDYKML